MLLQVLQFWHLYTNYQYVLLNINARDFISSFRDKGLRSIKYTLQFYERLNEEPLLSNINYYRTFLVLCISFRTHLSYLFMWSWTNDKPLFRKQMLVWLIPVCFDLINTFLEQWTLHSIYHLYILLHKMKINI